MRQIRYSIFETNSSSTHTFCLVTKNPIKGKKLPKNRVELTNFECDIDCDPIVLREKKDKISYVFGGLFLVEVKFKDKEYWSISDEVYEKFGYETPDEPIDITKVVKEFEPLVGCIKVLCEKLKINFSKVKFFARSLYFYSDEDQDEIGEHLYREYELYKNNENPVFMYMDYIVGLIKDKRVVFVTGNKYPDHKELLEERTGFKCEKIRSGLSTTLS